MNKPEYTIGDIVISKHPDREEELILCEVLGARKSSIG